MLANGSADVMKVIKNGLNLNAFYIHATNADKDLSNSFKIYNEFEMIISIIEKIHIYRF